MTELAGKVALVTGGSRGIGAAIAQRLAGDGAAVALTYVNAKDKAEAVAQQIEAQGGRALVIQADNADPLAAAEAVERTISGLGRIDILINNAGIFTGGSLDQVTLQQLDEIIAVDVRAVFLASQAAARHMTSGGRIITIGSALAERVPADGMTLYAMCKCALTGLTKGLARELGPRGITATMVNGGLIDTDMNPANGPAAAFAQRHHRTRPLRHPGRHRRDRCPPRRPQQPLHHRHRHHRRRRIRRLATIAPPSRIWRRRRNLRYQARRRATGRSSVMVPSQATSQARNPLHHLSAELQTRGLLG